MPRADGLEGTGPQHAISLGGGALACCLTLYQLTSLVLGPPAAREIRVAWSIDSVETQEARAGQQAFEDLRPQLGELLKPALQPAPAEPSLPSAGPIPHAVGSIPPAAGPIPPAGVPVPSASPLNPPADDDETHAGEYD